MTLHLHLFVSAALAVLGADFGNTVSAEERSLGGEIGCQWPINPQETGLTILKHYGKQARVAPVAGIDGEGGPGLQLFPEDPTLLLEIQWPGDVIRSKPTVLYLRETSSKWTISGLKVGMTLEEATAVYGAPFDLTGFDQTRDGGPNAVSAELSRGKLRGGCRVVAVFSAPGVTFDMLGPLYGADHIAPDNPQLLKINPVLSDLLILWDPPPQ